jgi:DNA-binding GntR family transcriptional regulator
MVRTMHESLHRKLRTELAARINGGHLQPGERLPAERELADEFGVARSVVRQAVAGLARDGLVVSVYPRGHRVLGPRIPWLPRLRPLTAEPWDVEVIDVARAAANPRDAAALAIDVGDPVVLRPFELRDARSGEPWALALATYPLDAFDGDARALVLGSDFIVDDELARVSGRRIVGYHERVQARVPVPAEQTSLRIDDIAAVLVVTRIARTTINPLSKLEARADRFEVDYLIEV